MTLVASLTSCKYDDEKLWDAVDSLNNRMEKVESILVTMNQDISSINNLVKAIQQNLFITEVKEFNNGYIIKFSDGSKATILNGEDGKDGKDGIDAPIINVRFHDGKYYWVQTINGETTWLLDIYGNMIPASGTDAITPLLKVDSDGYWIVSYDNGYTYSKVLNEEDNPIKASGEESSSFFESVEAKDDELIIVLKDGTEIILPIGEQSPYKAINLGLSVKWSAFNLGATTSTEQGGLYMWGDPSGEGVFGYYEAPNTDKIYGTKYDIVRATWGGKWRLPSKSEQTELIKECIWERATINGISGMKVIGKNGNSIFLPATGYGIPQDGPIGQTTRTDLSNGYYWVGESYLDEYGRFGYAYYWNSTSYYYNGSWNTNWVKMAIRPVKE